MPKIQPDALRQVQEAFERYKQEVDGTELKPTSKQTYLNRAECFVRWLYDDFEPGINVRRSSAR